MATVTEMNTTAFVFYLHVTFTTVSTREENIPKQSPKYTSGTFLCYYASQPKMT